MNRREPAAASSPYCGELYLNGRKLSRFFKTSEDAPGNRTRRYADLLLLLLLGVQDFGLLVPFQESRPLLVSSELLIGR